MRIAKAKGKLRGKQPKLNPRQEAHLVDLYRQGEHSTAELADLFAVARSTVYRALNATGPEARRTVTEQCRAVRTSAGELRFLDRRVVPQPDPAGQPDHPWIPHRETPREVRLAGRSRPDHMGAP